MPQKSSLVIIDGNALLHRAYHALPRMTDRQGRLVNAVYGFVSILLKTLNELNPEYVVATFDLAAPTFRHKMYKDYKGHRDKGDSELYEQFPYVKKILKSLSIPILEKRGYEADDIIGTISSNQKKAKNIIITGDLDTLQLINDNTVVYTPKRSVNEIIIYDKDKVQERYGLKPEQVADLKGLWGDASDNIPGVKGIGEKTATELLKKYKNITNIYNNLDNIKDSVRKKLQDQEDQALFSKELATIKTDIPIKFKLRDCIVREYNHEEAVKALQEHNFRSLIKRLPVPKLSEEISELEKLIDPILRKIEKRGVKINKEYLKRLNKKITSKLNKLETEIYIEAEEEFNILSPVQAKKHKNLINQIKKYRSLYKIKSSYIEPLLEVKGKVHTTYNSLGTATGRISSSNPNLQNIPEIIKPAFIAGKNNILISADYSQIELRIVASISEDQKLIKAFEENKDIHTITAQQLFNKIKITQDERQQAKTVNFSIIYGVSPYGLARTMQMPIEEAHSFIQEYMLDFPGVANYINEIKELARKQGYVETLLGRKRYLSNYRQAINHPIQGTQADIIKLAMIKLDKIAPMVLQVHDELVFEVAKRKAKNLIPKIKDIMENIFPLKVPLKVDVKTGANWAFR